MEVGTGHGRLGFAAAYAHRYSVDRFSVVGFPVVILAALRVAVAPIETWLTGPVFVVVVLFVIIFPSGASAALAVRVMLAAVMVVLRPGAGQVEVLDEFLESLVLVTQCPHLPS